MKKRGSQVLLDADTVEAVCVAEMGQNNDVVRRETGACVRTGQPLTNGQIQYRLTKAKEIAGFKKGDGFRKAWREGRSEFARMARRAVLPKLRADYQQTIAAQIANPEPGVISQARFEQGWRAKAARYERARRKAA